MRVRDCIMCGLPFAARTDDPGAVCSPCRRRNGRQPPLVEGGQGRGARDVIEATEGIAFAILAGLLVLAIALVIGAALS